ncbi:MAG: glycosyltransferase family 9 protein [Candidatus Omnitrophota bacterium]|nr:glycosyltransferase family 9 protein [Candidatus Omnitrophota bacterium]
MNNFLEKFFKKNKLIIYLLDKLIFIVFLPVIILDKTKRKKSSNFYNILIIELWGIGDLVMMSPILKSLKSGFPQARITLLSKNFGKDLLGNCEYVDKFVEFDFPWTRFKGKYRLWDWDWKSLIRIIKKLKKEKFDLVLDARGDIRNNLLSFLVGTEKRVGYGWRGAGYFLTDIGSPDFKLQHRSKAWINLLFHLGIKEISDKPFISIERKAADGATDFLRNQGIRDGELVIGIHPGAGVKTRCWPLDRFAKVAEYIRDNYHAKILVFVEPGGYANDIPVKGEILKVKLVLRELITLISKLDLLICNDSGVMHIASAVDTQTIAIFGPGDITKIGPIGDKCKVVMKQNVSCRPCFDNCKFDRPFCLDAIKVVEVIEAVDSVVGKDNVRLSV